MESVFDFIGEIAKRAEIAVKTEDEYIGDDGLIYCSKCRTPKQVELNGKRFYGMCDCQATAYREEVKTRRQREISEKNRALAFPPNSLYPVWRFENDNGENPDLLKTAKNYVEKFEEFKSMHKGLLFFGEKGRGKSFAAACVANALIDKLYKVYMTNFPRIANELQNTYSGRNQYIDELCSSDLLIIDDFEAERDTGYMREIVFQIIDTRYNTGLPLILTTNMSGDEIKANNQYIDKARIISRLLEMCHPVEAKGKDLRREKLKSDYANVEQMLRA